MGTAWGLCCWCPRICPPCPTKANQLHDHWAAQVIDYLLDVFFIFDIVASMRTAYKVEGDWVLEPRVIALQYAKSPWLAIDLLSVFPLEVFSLGSGGTGSKAFAVCRLPRWISRLFSSMFKPDKAERAKTRTTNVVAIRIGRVVRMFTYFLFLAHWIGCFWWALGVSEMDLDRTFSSDYARKKLNVWQLRPNKKSLELPLETPLGQRYLSSMYWALSTLMKTAWIPPGTTSEKLFAACVVFSGAILFAFILASVSAVVNAFDEANAKRREKISTMLRFTGTRNINPSVTQKILSYVDAEWTWTGGIDPGSFFSNASLPGRLQGELLRAMHTELIAVSPLFKTMSAACITKLVAQFVPQACCKKNVVVQAGELCFETYILVKGSLNFLVDDSLLGAGANGDAGDTARESSSSSPPAGRKTKSKKIKSNFRVIERPGACFGVWSPHVAPWRSPYVATALKLSHLFGIRADALKRAVAEFKTLGEDRVVLANLEKEFTQVVGKEGVATQKALYNLGEGGKPIEAPAESGLLQGQAKQAPNDAAMSAVVVKSTSALQEIVTCEELLRSMRKEAGNLPTVLAAVQFMIDPDNAEIPEAVRASRTSLRRPSVDESPTARGGISLQAKLNKMHTENDVKEQSSAVAQKIGLSSSTNERTAGDDDGIRGGKAVDVVHMGM